MRHPFLHGFRSLFATGVVVRVLSIKFAGRPMLVAVCLCIFVFTALPAAIAYELRTYQLIDGQERLFHCRGGLAYVDVSAQLAGSFTVEIDDGTSTITQFDVYLSDIFDQGDIELGWSEGEQLADLLFVSPLGLTGTSSGSSLGYGFPSAPDWQTPITTISVTQVGLQLAEVHIDSFTGTLDTPSFLTDSPGFLATYSPWIFVPSVPEPGTGAMAIVAMLIVAVPRWVRNRDRTVYSS